MINSFIAPPTTDGGMWLGLGALFIITFLLGSIPWGVIISRVFFKKDLRKEGSGNIGTTNAMRSMGKRGGAVVFILDFGKGLLAGAIGVAFGDWLASSGSFSGFGILSVGANVSAGGMGANVGDAGALSADAAGRLISQFALAISFLGCVWGHIFCPWLKFHGGKGIAVAVGNLFFLFGWAGALLELAIFIVVVLITRYVSAGSIAAALACPFFAAYYYAGNILAIVTIILVAVTIIWAHRENIGRLITGNENRIGGKK